MPPKKHPDKKPNGRAAAQLQRAVAEAVRRRAEQARAEAQRRQDARARRSESPRGETHRHRMRDAASGTSVLPRSVAVARDVHVSERDRIFRAELTPGRAREVQLLHLPPGKLPGREAHRMLNPQPRGPHSPLRKPAEQVPRPPSGGRRGRSAPVRRASRIKTPPKKRPTSK